MITNYLLKWSFLCFFFLLHEHTRNCDGSEDKQMEEERAAKYGMPTLGEKESWPVNRA